MSEITLIVPSIAETQCTGFRLGAERVIRRSLWRVEFWENELYPLIFKNGTRVTSLGAVPEYVAKFANSVQCDVLRT